MAKKPDFFSVDFNNPFDISVNLVPSNVPSIPTFEVEGFYTGHDKYKVQSAKFDIFDSNDKSVRLSSGRIDKKTLSKGAPTLIGMSPQFNKQGEMVQGFNYAKPNFATGGTGGTYSVFGIDAIRKAEKAGDIETAKAVATVLGVTAGSSSARLKNISRNRAQAEAQFWKAGEGGDMLGQANSIRAQMGLMPIVVETRNRRASSGSSSGGRTSSGRWVTELLVSSYTNSGFAGSADPVGEVQAYYDKKALVEWATEYGLKLEPTDARSFRTGTIQGRQNRVWTSAGGRQKIVTDTFDQPVMSEVMMPENDVQRVTVLYDKLVSQSQKKKEEYDKMYDPLEGEYALFNYFAIPDTDIESSKKYQSDLRSGIATLNTAEDEYRNFLAKSPFVDATSDVDDNSPKSRYLAYQKSQQSEIGKQATSEIQPVVDSLSSKISTVENDILQQENIIKASESRITSLYEAGAPIRARGMWGDAGNACSWNRRNSEDCSAWKAGVQIKSEIGVEEAKITNAKNRLNEINTDTSYRERENTNLQNAIQFVTGKTKDFVANNQVIATRSNLGEIKVETKDIFDKYITNLPTIYFTSPDQDTSKMKISELESMYSSEEEAYKKLESEASYRARAEAELSNTYSPRRLPSHLLRLQKKRR